MKSVLYDANAEFWIGQGAKEWGKKIPLFCSMLSEIVKHLVYVGFIYVWIFLNILPET